MNYLSHHLPSIHLNYSAFQTDQGGPRHVMIVERYSTKALIIRAMNMQKFVYNATVHTKMEGKIELELDATEAAQYNVHKRQFVIIERECANWMKHGVRYC